MYKQLLRVYLPGNVTTLLQVKDEMTMAEILNTVCEKKMMDPSTHAIVLHIDGKELEALPDEVYSLYKNTADVHIKPKSAQSKSALLEAPRMTRRRCSIQMNAPKSEIKSTEFPQTIVDFSSQSMAPDSPLSRNTTDESLKASMSTHDMSSLSGTLKGKALMSLTGMFKKAGGDEMKKSSSSSFASLSLEDRRDSSSPDQSSPISPLTPTSARHSPSGVVTSPDYTFDDTSVPQSTSVQFQRKRNSSSGTIKIATLKRNQFRARSVSEQTSPILESSELSGVDLALVRIQVENEFTTVKFPVAKQLTELLKTVTMKFNLDFEEYTIELPNGNRIDLDRTLEFYINTVRVAELRILKGTKTYSTISIMENGEEILVLSCTNGGQIVMAGTPEKMIERATDDSEKDLQFVDMFLMTFRSFMKPVDVFDELIARFNATLPENPSPEDMAYFEKTKGITQMKVVQILKWWTKNYWHDYAFTPELKTDLEDFVEVLSAIPEFTKSATELRGIIETQTEREEQLADLHRSIDSKKKTMESMFETIEVEELAQQMAVHNFKLFRHIHPIEFLNQIWRKKDSGAEWSTPNLDFFSSRFDRESYWVATEILSQKDMKKRSNYLKRFIQLGKECQLLGNFFSMFSIYVGLNLTPVQRLKKTWETITPKHKQFYDELEKACDPSKNMKAYRELLAATKPPTLPFLPIYLKDLTFMNDGNASKHKNMINFDKLRMMANRTRDITNLSSTPYAFVAIPPIQNYLHKPHIEMNLTKLKEESLKCEPQQ